MLAEVGDKLRAAFRADVVDAVLVDHYILRPWVSCVPMPADRHGFGGGVVDNTLYFAGGATGCGGGGRTNELLVFNLS